MAAPDKQRSRAVTISPEHCGGDLRRADEMRAACDAFFRRRGLNAYGGNRETVGGMAGIVKAAAERGKAKKVKKEEIRGQKSEISKSAKRGASA